MKGFFALVLMCRMGACYAQELHYKAPLPQRPLLSIVLLISLLCSVLVLLWFKKKNVPPTGGALTLLEKKHLSAKCALYVVEYQGVKFFLADNQQHLLLLPTPEKSQCQ